MHNISSDFLKRGVLKLFALTVHVKQKFIVGLEFIFKTKDLRRIHS